MTTTNGKIQLQCPLPKTETEIITLGHGSGGILTNQLLECGVFSLFQNQYLDERHDGSVLKLNGKIAFTTDSFVISPIFFPGGNIGELAVYGTVNDLAMCGAIPQFLSLGFILEEGLAMEDFREILAAIKAAADVAGVEIVTGDTKVVERGKGDQIFVNTTGIGHLHPQANISATRIQPGDKIIVNGEIASHGIAIMSVREGFAFESDILSDTAPLHLPVLAMLDVFGSDIHCLRDATRGGIATVLNEIARKCSLGIDIRETAIPLQSSVAGACEILGLDPLYVANEGKFLSFVAAEVADEALALLASIPGNSRASIIGEVVAAHPGKVIATSVIGGRRAVGMLPGEQLPRIC